MFLGSRLDVLGLAGKMFRVSGLGCSCIFKHVPVRQLPEGPKLFQVGRPWITALSSTVPG